MKNNIYLALSLFQKECPVIHKGTQGYGYSYADLPAIFDVINPILGKYNLGFTQPIIGTKVKTVLFHTETGETIESETDIPQNVQLKEMNDFQVLGSAITYIRRYALSSMLGIITDKDNDASGEQQKPVPNLQPPPSVKAKKKITLGSDDFNSLVVWIKSGKGTIQKVKDNYDIADLDLKALENEALQ